MPASFLKVPKTRLLRSDIVCPRIGFGGSRLHYLSYEAERQALLGLAYDLGMTYFDIAPVYGHGLAERSVGRFLSENPALRNKIVVATKWGIPGARWIDVLPQSAMRAGVMAEAILRRVLGARDRPILSRQVLRSSFEASLRRLKTDHIDILWMHEPETTLILDPDGVLEELEALRKSGRIRAYGVAGYARHLRPTLALLNKSTLLRQCDEGEWTPDDPPDVTFGAISHGPQRVNAPSVPRETAAERLRLALRRRAEGTVLISTTQTENLRHLIGEMVWRDAM